MALDLDIHALRTLVAIADLGTFAKAGQQIGRTAPAVGLQMRKLEQQLGVTLFRRAGRRMALTSEGERLLACARRMVRLNDSVVGALSHEALRGEIRVGATQDFADTLLPQLLERFAMRHPGVRMAVEVGRSQDLAEGVLRDRLDVALGAGGVNALAHPLGSEQMVWIARPDLTLDADAPIPLAVFDAPCPFRESAIAALDQAGRDWIVSYTTPSLSGLRAAVLAGLGVTVRTDRLLTPGLADARGRLGLPQLPKVKFSVYVREADPRPQVRAFVADIEAEFAGDQDRRSGGSA